MASKRRKNSTKFKWTKELIILIVALIAIITTTIILSVPSEKEKYTDEINTAITIANASNSQSGTSYNTIPADNVFAEISHKNLVNKINKDEYVYVLYGSLNNNTLLENLYAINLMCTNEEIKSVYIYSSLWVEETEDLETETFKEKQNAIEADLNANKNKDVEEFTLLEYPAILVFKNGELVFNSQGYEDVQNQITWSNYIQKAFMISKNNE